MLLIATAGSPLANSYATVADANTLLSPLIHPALMESETQTALADALIEATRLLDVEVRWIGSPATSTQALAWPRLGVRTPQGQELSSATIPIFLQYATALYALHLLASVPSAAATTLEVAGAVKSVRTGDVEVVFRDDPVLPTAQAATPTLGMPATVRRLLLPYGRVAGGATIELVRT